MLVNSEEKTPFEKIKNENLMKQKMLILGGVKLKGIIKISPAKNAILPLIASLIVTKDSVRIPYSKISDCEKKLKLLEIIGYKIEKKGNQLEIKPSEEINNHLPTELTQSIRSSILFLGPMLALKKKVKISFPGGDDLQRKHNYHLECLEKMGAKFVIKDQMIYGEIENQLKGTEYTFERPSVGATQHLVLTGILMKKDEVLILNNCAQEPECMFLINVLINYFGANIKVIGSQITITGNGDRLSIKNKIHNISIPQDRIEALTYLTMALMTDGEITIDCNNPLDIIGGKDLSLLLKAGALIKIEESFITIKRNGPLQSVKYFESGEFPQISTDFCPIFCSLMGMANGTSIFTETIYGNNRLKYIYELNNFGGIFRLHNEKSGTIVIDGSHYIPSQGKCTDIRGGIALLLAALSAKGCSTLHDIYHIFRGYEYLIERINSLGGKIKILKEEESF